MIAVFANGPGDLGSITSRVIRKTQKMVFDTNLLNTQYQGSRVKWRNPGNGVVPSPTPYEVAIEKGAFGSPSTTVAKFTFIYIYIYIYIYI